MEDIQEKVLLYKSSDSEIMEILLYSKKVGKANSLEQNLSLLRDGSSKGEIS